MKVMLCFLAFVSMIAVVGYLGIDTATHINKNYENTATLIDYVFLLDETRVDVARLIETDNIDAYSNISEKISGLRERYESLANLISQAYAKELVHAMKEHDDEIDNISSRVIAIHGKKLRLDEIFNEKYVVEKQQRTNIRVPLFALNNSKITQDVGNMQYYSKEALYQYGNREKVDEWLQSIDNVRESVISAGLPENESAALLAGLDVYKQTSKTMGDISIRRKEIEAEEIKYLEEMRETTTHVETERKEFMQSVLLENARITEDVMRTQSAVIFIAFAISIALTFAISRIISKPVTELTDAVKDVSRGNFSRRIRVHSGDEIQELADSFNIMTRALKSSKKKLEHFNKTLKAQVAKRTSDLQQKVTELEHFNKLSVGRELKMIELKKRIKELEGKR